LNPSEKENKIFVYGLLRTSEGLDDAIKCNNVFVVERSFPAVVGVDKGERLFYGQVLTVDDNTLQRFDQIENVPHLYRRIKTETLLGVSAWIYEFNIEMQSKRLLEIWPYNKWI